MTIVEFLHPIKSGSLRDISLAALYFQQRYNQVAALTVEELRVQLKRASIAKAAKANLADALSKSAPYVETLGKKGHRFLWSLTRTGEDHVRTLLGLLEAEAEIEHDVSSLVKLIGSITDRDVADYVQESIKCLSVGALRAAVVFLWAGAVRKIRELVVGCGIANVNTTAAKHDPKARTIRHIDDLAYFKESTLLLVAQDLGIYDKNQRGILEESLNLRNKCGHPGRYKIGQKKASSFIEDIVGIVFT